MHIHLTEADFKPENIAKRIIGCLLHFVSAGNVEGLKAIIGTTETLEPGYWETTAGRFSLRFATIRAVEEAHLPIVQFLCEERGVAALGDDANDEYGTDLLPIVTALLSSICILLSGGNNLPWLSPSHRLYLFLFPPIPYPTFRAGGRLFRSAQEARPET